MYSVGDMKDNSTRFEGSPLAVLDHGPDCCCQSCAGHDGQQISISWMASWNSKFPTAKLGHGWSMMTLPACCICAATVWCSSLHRRWSPSQRGQGGADGGYSPSRCWMCASMRRSTGSGGVCQDAHLELMRTCDEAVRLTWENDMLTLDHCDAFPVSDSEMTDDVHTAGSKDGRISLRVYVDACAVEGLQRRSDDRAGFPVGGITAWPSRRKARRM